MKPLLITNQKIPLKVKKVQVPAGQEVYYIRKQPHNNLIAA